MFSTSTRAIIFDLKGQIIAISQKELTQHYPQSGWVEHDANEIYKDQKAAFEAVLQDAKVDPKEVAAIGITNQRETTVVWDKETGEPIHKAIVWLDKRTTDICEELKAQGLEEEYKEKIVLSKWEELVGKPIAMRTDSLKITNKILYIKLNSSVMRNELSHRKSEIIKIINTEAGHQLIYDVFLS